MTRRRHHMAKFPPLDPRLEQRAEPGTINMVVSASAYLEVAEEDIRAWEDETAEPTPSAS